MRARNVKPGLCTNEDLAECSIEARLLFALLPMCADRDGRLEDRPKRIKGELFRYDSLEVDPLLDELARGGFIARYTVDGRALIQILAFAKHQNPHHREPESTLPPHPSLRQDADGKWVQPEAQSACQPSTAQGEPGASLRNGTTRADLASGPSRADSGFLIPDPGSRSPDSGALIPEDASLRSASSAGVADATVAPRSKKPKEPARTAAAWDAYSRAYFTRYGTPPVRNASVNGQLATLVKKLGEEEAPHVASFYVGHQRQDYVRSMHDVGLLVRDASALRTQWATRRIVTATAAAQADRTQANADAFAPLLQEARAREAQEQT